MVDISVVIPTHNRSALLRRCLEHLLVQQTDGFVFEIVVCDDGSTDATAAVARQCAHNASAAIKYLYQHKCGPAAARNKAIRESRGNILLFLGDDMISPPDLLTQHYSLHLRCRQKNQGVLGHITWSSGIAVTPFMRWLEDGGRQFAFGLIKDPLCVDPAGFFYASNVSLKKSFLLETGCFFDESFTHAACEDMELGYRLKQKGFTLVYNKDARAWHEHATTLGDACRRMIIVGESDQMLREKTGRPLLPMRRSPWRRAGAAVKSRWYYFAGLYYQKRSIEPRIFSYLMEYYYYRGAGRYTSLRLRYSRRRKNLLPRERFTTRLRNSLRNLSVLRRVVIPRAFSGKSFKCAGGYTAAGGARFSSGAGARAAAAAKVAVIIVNWNGKNDTLECLESVFGIGYSDYEVIVADNGSSDGSCESFTASFPRVILIRRQANDGFCAAANEAIRLAEKSGAGYVFLLNNDMTVEPAVIAELKKVLDENPDIGAVSPLIAYYHRREELQFFGARIDWANGELLGRYDKTNLPAQTLLESDMVSWGAALVRMQAIKAAGLLDESLFMYYEDHDWGVRCRKKGMRTVVYNRLLVYHKTSASSGGEYSPLFYFYYFRNRLYFMRRHASFPRKIQFSVNYVRDITRLSRRLEREGKVKCADALHDALWSAVNGCRFQERQMLPAALKPLRPAQALRLWLRVAAAVLKPETPEKCPAFRG